MDIDIGQIQDHEDPYWTKNLRGMLGMLDQIMRLDGRNEELFKRNVADFMWKVLQANLDATTGPRHEKEFEHCGTFPKFKGDPSISHLIADAYPRRSPTIDAINASLQFDEE